ncbi:MAG: HD domain-containing protein, partial [Myxococcota bacterium]
MNPPITDYWAKLERDPDDPDILVAWHPLIHHCADVAAVFESLLHIETINRRIARLAGKERLGVADIERLCFFAAIHDLGKTNHGFNAKAGQSEYGGRAGHVTEALWLISG